MVKICGLLVMVMVVFVSIFCFGSLVDPSLGPLALWPPRLDFEALIGGCSCAMFASVDQHESAGSANRTASLPYKAQSPVHTFTLVTGWCEGCEVGGWEACEESVTSARATPVCKGIQGYASVPGCIKNGASRKGSPIWSVDLVGYGLKESCSPCPYPGAIPVPLHSPSTRPIGVDGQDQAGE
jgi:hypothetical protein